MIDNERATRKTRTATHVVHVLNAGPLGMSGIIRTPRRRRKEGDNRAAQKQGYHQDLPLAVPVESVEKRDDGRQEHVDEESRQDCDDDFRWGFLNGGKTVSLRTERHLPGMLTLPIRLKTRYHDISKIVASAAAESSPCQWYENIQEL